MRLHRLHERGRSPQRQAWIARRRAVEEHYLSVTRPQERTRLKAGGA
ncbi:hypothetical protein ACIP4Y_36635 [Streptomyces sp. NPDC088810]